MKNLFMLVVRVVRVGGCVLVHVPPACCACCVLGVLVWCACRVVCVVLVHGFGVSCWCVLVCVKSGCVFWRVVLVHGFGVQCRVPSACCVLRVGCRVPTSLLGLWDFPGQPTLGAWHVPGGG